MKKNTVVKTLCFEPCFTLVTSSFAILGIRVELSAFAIDIFK